MVWCVGVCVCVGVGAGGVGAGGAGGGVCIGVGGGGGGGALYMQRLGGGGSVLARAPLGVNGTKWHGMLGKPDGNARVENPMLKHIMLIEVSCIIVQQNTRTNFLHFCQWQNTKDVVYLYIFINCIVCLRGRGG